MVLMTAHGTDALIAEMRMFPNGQHDDQIDQRRAFGELLDTRTGMIDYLRSQVEATNECKTPLSQGFIARVAAGVRYAFTGNADDV